MMYNKHHYIDHVGHIQPIDTGLSVRFLESKHRQLNRQLVQWTVSLAISKLFNVFMCSQRSIVNAILYTIFCCYLIENISSMVNIS